MKGKKQLPKSNTDLTKKIESVIRKVLTAERQKLHMRNPRGIIEDIRKIIEKEIDPNDISLY